VAAVERCRPYFGTHGGVTLSGGEPLMQAAFAGDILKHCRQRGIHTALDTSGCVMNPSVLACLDETNLVILDIKHADPQRHKALAGFELSRSIGFLQRVVERNIPLWVRQVVIPGWNDSPADMKALAGLLFGVPTLRKVELLGFHRMAVEKYAELGIVYPLADTPEPSEEHIRELQTTLDSLLDFA
jgi:pyruvate formate lyase activating enzyme